MALVWNSAPRRKPKAEAPVSGPWSRFWQMVSFALFILVFAAVAWLLAGVNLVLYRAFTNAAPESILEATRYLHYPVNAVLPLLLALAFAGMMQKVVARRERGPLPPGAYAGQSRAGFGVTTFSVLRALIGLGR